MSQVPRRPRAGYASIIAMILLVIGTALATGFAAMLRSSQEIAANQQAVRQAKGAAESGLAFLTYKLRKVAPAAGMPGRASAQWIVPLRSALQAELEYTANLGSGRVTAVQVTDPDGSVVTGIDIPPIILEDSTSFSAIITPTPAGVSPDNGLGLRVTGKSRSGTVTRQLAINLNCDPERVMSALRFSIAARQTITLPTSNNGGIYGYDPAAGAADTRVGDTVTIGASSAVVLHQPGEVLPDFSSLVNLVFPQTDTAFLDAEHAARFPAISMPRKNGQVTGTLSSTYIPSGAGTSNKPLDFGDVTINGILYVEWPNVITFSGDTKLNGVIVYQPSTGTGNSSITMARDVPFYNDRAKSLDQLTAISWLTDAQRKTLSSWAIIAPDTDLTLNNGTVKGSDKYFENSIHIKNMDGSGAPQGASLITNQASIIAEGAVDLRGNRLFWMLPPDDTGLDSSGYVVRDLYVMQTTYREPR